MNSLLIILVFSFSFMYFMHPPVQSPCHFNGPLPDATCTPGKVLDTDSAVVCNRTTRGLRVDLASVKIERMQAYGLDPQNRQNYELDHLISLELGGSNDVDNLWPQSYVGTWNAHLKDRLENRLHSLVCLGDMTLEEAQHEIATDWVSAYEKYISH